MECLRDYVAETMVRDRFEEIKSNIHLADNNGNDFTDKLFKVRPLVDHLRREFKKIPSLRSYASTNRWFHLKGILL